MSTRPSRTFARPLGERELWMPPVTHCCFTSVTPVCQAVTDPQQVGWATPVIGLASTRRYFANLRGASSDWR